MFFSLFPTNSPSNQWFRSFHCFSSGEICSKMEIQYSKKKRTKNSNYKFYSPFFFVFHTFCSATYLLIFSFNHFRNIFCYFLFVCLFGNGSKFCACHLNYELILFEKLKFVWKSLENEWNEKNETFNSQLKCVKMCKNVQDMDIFFLIQLYNEEILKWFSLLVDSHRVIFTGST